MSVSKSPNAAWLLLTFTLPAKRASKRVEIWRKLQRYGTVPLGNSGYLLPSNPMCEERFQWLATSIRKYGGDASVVHVKAIDNISTPQLIRQFTDARTREYRALIREIQKAFIAARKNRSIRWASRLRSRFNEIVEVDFFNSPVQKYVLELFGRLDISHVRTPIQKNPRVNRQTYKNRLWVTRPRPGVDRCSSAWLIRRFIDSKARFGFASEDQAPKAAVRFDMFEGGFGHRGDDCTFETLQKEFRIRDRKVKIISEIVHDADLADGKFGQKEGYGVDAVLKGWARKGVSDQQLLDRGMQLIEGLYHSVA
jgi:hypothetical protein